MGKKADSAPAKWRRRLWGIFRGKHRNSRWLRVIVILALFVGTFHFLENYQTYRTALAIKYTPTTFSRLTLEEQATLQSPRWQWAAGDQLEVGAGPGQYSRQSLLDARDRWTRLGGGVEGHTFRHGDHVVKVYRREHAPFRNCHPGSAPDLRWPTEIAASLILGGIVGSDGVREDASFLPVTDYFLSPPTEIANPEWHFVTPFLPNGNLVELSKRLRESAQYMAREVDILFRPSLNSLLQTLDRMHSEYDLCHDDLKPDNIFLGSRAARANETTHWLLGDLGNVREREHPYHTSLLWTTQKSNLPDCRANDLLRLVKAYMQFLRSSVRDADAFDRQLFEAHQPWSRLFWSVLDDVMHGGESAAMDTLDKSITKMAPGSEPVAGIGRQPSELRNPLYGVFLGRAGILAMASKKLLAVRAAEKAARIWGLVPMLGVPYSACHVGTG
ncbi:hypothetical protein ACO1O0_003575 [Amphichorda felina]